METPDLSQNAAIITSDGAVRVQLTDADVLWAARSCAGEILARGHESATETDEADVLWTLTQRYVRWLQLGKDFDFTASTRSFSQPINPKWESLDAAGCRAYPSACTPEKMARRAALREAGWGDLAALDAANGTRIVESTRLWAAGRLLNTVPNATNFAVPKVAANYMAQNPKSVVVAKRGGHWYISDPPATRWPIDHVLIESPDGRYVAGVGQRDRFRLQTVAAARAFWDTVTLQSFWDWG